MAHLSAVTSRAQTNLHAFVSKLPASNTEQVVKQIHGFLEGPARWMFVSLPTGSGKTLYLSSQCLLDPNIGETWITEPTVTSAVSIYRTLASKMGQRTDSAAWVGYGAGGEAWYTSRTRLKVMTTGHCISHLLRLITNKGGARTSKPFHVILDEMHHPTTENHVALMLLKHLTLTLGVHLHVTVSSATLDRERLELGSFADAATVEQEDDTRRFPITETFCANGEPPYAEAVRLCLDIALRALGEHPKSSGIVFLAGEDCVLKLAAKLDTATADTVEVLAVYSNMPNEVLDQVTGPCPVGKRRVFVATNVAETGITLPDADWVVDSGYCKMIVAASTPGAQALELTPISRANAKQRAGRVGRCRPGFVYRAYGESVPRTDHMSSEFETVPPYAACLKVVAASVEVGVLGMPAERERSIIEELVRLKVLADSRTLTTLGRRVNSIPVSVNVAAALLDAVDALDTAELLAVTAFLAVVETNKFSRLFYVPPGSRSGQDYQLYYEDTYQNWLAEDDFEAVVRVLLAADRSKLRSWCRQHGFNDHTIQSMLSVADTLIYHGFYCTWADVARVYAENAADSIDFEAARRWLYGRFAVQTLCRTGSHKYVSQSGKEWRLDSKRLLYRPRDELECVLPMNLFENRAGPRSLLIASCIVRPPSTTALL